MVVLLLLLLAYMLNQLDRYTVAIVSRHIEHDLEFGEKACLLPLDKPDLAGNTSLSKFCANFTSADTCGAHASDDCAWDYDGKGIEYQVLAGTVFTVIYTIAGIPMGWLAERKSRKNLLALSLLVWSVATILTGTTQAYWQIVLTRLLLGFAVAGCTPFAASLIADYFGAETRGTALGIYNFGIYTGYSLSFAIGNGIEEALNWRWVFYICGIPGIILCFVIFFVVKEPVRGGLEKGTQAKASPYSLKQTLMFFLKAKSLILLCIAGAIRNAGGYVWALETTVFLENHYFLSKGEINKYMSWIPLVGGSLGALLGGMISDRVLKTRGPTARIWVLVITQILATPFAAGALFMPVPWNFISLIPANVIGEAWVGVTLAVVIELVPVPMRTTSVAIYLFIISVIGGNMNLLIPPLTKVMSLQYALLIMYPGFFALSAVLFLITLFSLKSDIRKAQADEQALLPTLQESEDRLSYGSNDDSKA